MADGESRSVKRRQEINSDEDDDFFSSFKPSDKGAEGSPMGRCPGKTVSVLPEEQRKKLLEQLIEGMFKYAEEKYGRKRPQKEVAKSTAKEDYELYLKSLKVRARQANEKLQTAQRQQKEIEKKVEETQKQADLHNEKLTKAEEEKQNAINENRDPVLPTDFRVPQRSKRLGATLGALVLKASKQDWTAALNQFASNRKGKDKQVLEWNVKRDKTAALLI